MQGSADRHSGAIGRQRYRLPGFVAFGFAVDIAAHLLPATARRLEDAHVARFVAIAVVVNRADRDSGSIRRQRHRSAGQVAVRLAGDVAVHLRPRGVAQLEHPYVAAAAGLLRAERDSGSVRRQRHRHPRIVLPCRALDVGADLGPGAAVPVVDADMASIVCWYPSCPVVVKRADRDSGSV